MSPDKSVLQRNQWRRGSPKKYQKDPAEQSDSTPFFQGALFKLHGYFSDSEMATATSKIMLISPCMTATPTIIILEEVAPKKMGTGEQVNIVISQDDFQYFWKRAMERAVSSFSGLHFGNYKAAAYSNVLPQVHVLKLSLITWTGSPSQWVRGLYFMLKKIYGVSLVIKLWAILLMEADINYHNRLIFGKRITDLVCQHNMVPEEIFSEKGKTAEDAILQQMLVYDLARQ